MQANQQAADLGNFVIAHFKRQEVMALKAATTKEAVTRLREFGPTCSPRQLASVLRGQPYRFTVLARNGKLPYEFDWHGSWLRIYTESVIRRITAI